MSLPRALLTTIFFFIAVTYTPRSSVAACLRERFFLVFFILFILRDHKWVGGRRPEVIAYCLLKP